MMYRQGDVLLIATSQDPEGPEQPRDRRRRIVLAYGEVTGHAHAIADLQATLYGTDLEDRFLEVLAEGGVTLAHEEHGPIQLPRGTYRIVRQREWTPDGTRWLAD
jgi:hypothetical protein